MIEDEEVENYIKNCFTYSINTTRNGFEKLIPNQSKSSDFTYLVQVTFPNTAPPESPRLCLEAVGVEKKGLIRSYLVK